MFPIGERAAALPKSGNAFPESGNAFPDSVPKVASRTQGIAHKVVRAALEKSNDF